jgi:hypothetical protein
MYLASGAPNRHLSKTALRRYTRDMKAGNWRPDSAIKFDSFGRLSDGQHRPTAVAESGVPCTFVVIRGETCQRTTDVGAKRSFAGQLAIDGELYSKQLAASVGWLLGFRNPKLIGTRSVSHMRTINEMYAELDRNPGLRDHVANATALGHKLHTSTSLLAAAMYLTYSIDAEDAEAFWHSMQTGKGLDLPGRSGIRLFRERITSEAGSEDKTSLRTIAALLVKAWNFYRAGEDVSVLTFRPGGKYPHPFPEFK